MALLTTPGINVQPNAQKVAVSTNYITNFDFLNQYLPDTYEQEFERYGNRTISSFLRQVSAEIPSNSDKIIWTEQGRLHTTYTSCTLVGVAGSKSGIFTVTDTMIPALAGGNGIAVRVGQTVFLSDNAATGNTNKGIVSAVTATTFTVQYYETGGATFAGLIADGTERITVFIYGSEFSKGTAGMVGSNEAFSSTFDNKPIILKDKYAVNGSDMAQIGWVNITGEGQGADGYYWFIKSKHDSRLRFEDYMETSQIEASPAVAGSGAFDNAGVSGTDGVFHVVETRGNVWGAGFPSTLANFDTVVQRLDKQGAIEENVIFLNRAFSFGIDNMLAGASGSVYGADGVSYGLFDNDKEMAVNLGFNGFRRGYDFYKSDWKYLNDATMRGGITSGTVNGLLVPAGTTSVYDEILGANAKRPFLHVRYRASQHEDRKYKTWITGSAGGAATSDIDVMEVNYLSERCTCTMGANNFVIFKD